MKLTSLLICVLVFTSVAGTRAQNQVVTLKCEQVSLLKVITELKKQTKLDFFYSFNEVDVDRQVSLDLDNAKIDEALRIIFGENFTWEYMDKMVVIKPAARSAHIAQQSVRITGKVTDEKKQPLPGVTVLVKGTTVGIATDMDGRYSLTVPAAEDLTLIFSFVGMEVQEVKYTGKDEINVTMKELVQDIEDVIVTGIFTRPKESFTGAVTVVRREDLQKAGTRSILTSLGNIDPSFRLLEDINIGSDPNALPNIVVRGQTSMDASVRDVQSSSQSRANEPLFIMDGFETTLQAVMDLDDNLVESIMLYKDASATAMYGAKGANGVVVITLVRPQEGKLRFSYTGRMNIEAPDLSVYNLMNAREKLEYEKLAGLYEYVRADNEQELLELYSFRLKEVQRGVDTYWLKYPVRTGVGHSHNLRVDGGREEIQYALDLSYRNTAGAMKGSDRNTFIGGMTLRYETGRLVFKNDLKITYNEAKHSPYGSYSDWGKINSYWTPYDDQGNLKKKLEDRYTYHSLINQAGVGSRSSNTVYNPLYNALLSQINEDRYTEIRNNFSIEWRILPELVFRGSVGITSQENSSDKYISALNTKFDTYAAEDFGRKGEYDYSTGDALNYTVRLTLDYAVLLDGKHQITAGGSFRVSEDKSKNYSFSAEGISNPSMDFIGMATSYAKGGAPKAVESISRDIGLTANAIYTYDNRYFVNLSGTFDGSSVYGANQRWAPFASVGIGWNLHNEAFGRSISWISGATLKASYGVVGSQNFSTTQALTTFKDFGNKTYGGWAGSYLMALGNDDLKWQNVDQLNLGMDLRLFNGLLSIDGNFYHFITNNLVNDITLPTSSGFPSFKANIGKVTNTGFELGASVYVIRNTEKELSWSIGGTMAHNKNKIRKISNTLKYLNETILNQDGADPSLIYEEGKSMNTLYAVKSLGIDPSNGKEIFVKKNGALTYDWSASDKVDCGENTPKYNGSINTSVRYKNLELTAYFNYAFGGQAYNQTLVSKLEDILPYQNADKRALYERWNTPGVHAKYKNIRDFTRTQSSSRFIMDENKLTFNTLTVGYMVNSPWIQQLGLSFLKISGNMEDIFYLSSIKRERGLQYPNSRKFSFSLQARF